jgi:hypothetical protein
LTARYPAHVEPEQPVLGQEHQLQQRLAEIEAHVMEHVGRVARQGMGVTDDLCVRSVPQGRGGEPAESREYRCQHQQEYRPMGLEYFHVWLNNNPAGAARAIERRGGARFSPDFGGSRPTEGSRG